MHSVFLLSNGTVYGCGQNYGGFFGPNATKTFLFEQVAPNLVSNDVKVTSVGISEYATILLLSNNSVFVSGMNRNGSMGLSA